MAAPAYKLNAEDNVELDATFVKAFLEGTMKTFSVQCNYELKAKRSYALKPTQEVPADISGKIDLISTHFSGTVYLCFTEKVFLGVMGSMFQETFANVNEELMDGAAELLNIIYGTAKTILTNNGLSLEKSIPVVLKGKEFQVSEICKHGRIVAVPFDTKDGILHVILSMKKK